MRRNGLPPLILGRPHVLIVGTFPSELSLKVRRYYESPGNRFWGILGRIIDRPMPEKYSGRKQAIAVAGIALWDVVKSCERPVGSSTDDKEDRLRRGYVLLEHTSRELASTFIHLAGELEDDYQMPERLLADLVDLTLEEVVEKTGWRPWRAMLVHYLDQRIRRVAIARAKKCKETNRRKKLKAAAEARRKAKEEARRAGCHAVEEQAPDGYAPTRQPVSWSV